MTCSYKDDMEPDELFEVVSQCLLSSVDRDAYSGWGAVVYIIMPDKIIERRLKTRMDYCLFVKKHWSRPRSRRKSAMPASG